MSTHDIGMRDLINALQILGKMPDVWLVVISIESLQQQGIEMTSTIRERIPALANTVQPKTFGKISLNSRYRKKHNPLNAVKTNGFNWPDR